MNKFINILLLHFDTINPTPYNLFNLIAPFFNEFANLFTITNIVNLYPNNPVNKFQVIKKNIIDFIAVIGIISNSIDATLKYNYLLGILKALFYLIFAFFIPNLFMCHILDLKIFKKNKLISGIFVIYLLELSIKILFYISKLYLL